MGFTTGTWRNTVAHIKKVHTIGPSRQAFYPLELGQDDILAFAIHLRVELAALETVLSYLSEACAWV